MSAPTPPAAYERADLTPRDGVLIMVEWCEANRSWLVSARADVDASWSHAEGDEAELDALLSIARDIATGG